MALRAFAAAAVLLLAATAGCGDDGSQGYVDDPRADARPRPPSNAACRGVRGHPVRIATDPLEGVLACASRDGKAIFVRNRSSQVLRVRPDDLYDRTRMALVKRRREPPGIDAAHSMTGAGLDARRESLVLPFGQTMTARSDSTVALTVEGDFELTVAANVARYLAEWIASELPVRGEKLVRPARECAASVRGAVDETGYVEDALRHAVQTPTCRRVIDDVARRNGADPMAERPKARAGIFGRARDVLRDPLRPRRTSLLARR